MKVCILFIFIFLLMVFPVYGGNAIGRSTVSKFEKQMQSIQELEVQQGKEQQIIKRQTIEQIKKIRNELEELKCKPVVEVKKEIEDYRVELKNLGYYKKDESDEEINNRNALLRFQSDHNLDVDGIYGKDTKGALELRLKDKDFKYVDTIEKPPTQEMWIVVNKTKRILTLYKGSQVIKKYPIAQGKLPNLTPEGKFTIVTKSINPAWGGAGTAQPIAGGSSKNPLGYRWMGISYGGGGSYGIHGNNNPKSIGTNASMGCIRMINSDVEEIYGILPLKTIVWIGVDEKLKEWGINQKSYTEDKK